MAKAYWFSVYRAIHDPAKMAAYAELAGPAVLSQGGRFLTRGGRVEAREEGLAARVVLVAFDSFDDAVSAYESPAYQEALALRAGAVERDFRIVEGTD